MSTSLSSASKSGESASSSAVEKPCCCCGDALQLEYEVYDDAGETLLFSGIHQWDFPPCDDEGDCVYPISKEGEFNPLSLSNGEYSLDAIGSPFATCPGSNQINVETATFGVSRFGIAYQTPSLLGSFPCPVTGEWGPWEDYANGSGAPNRFRIRVV